MENEVKRYYELKQQQKELEQELAQLRHQIIEHYTQLKMTEHKTSNGFEIKITVQHRKEYDDNKLYEALPDPDLWRMLSKADTAKINSLITLNVIPENKLQGTYMVKTITLLHVIPNL